MRSSGPAFAVIVAFSLMLAGCPGSGGGGSTNTNANDNANSNGNDNISTNGNTNDNVGTNGNVNDNENANDNTGTNGLTEAEQAAVEDAVAVLEATATTLAGASFVTDPPDGDGTFGECPEVTGAATDDTVEVTLDYGDGCSSEATGEAELSGSVTGTVDRATRSVTLVYEEFTIDEDSIDGTITFARTADPSDGDTFEIAADLTVSELGTIDATLTVTYDTETQQITLTDGSFTFTDEEGNSFEMTAEGLVFDAVASGNFIPEAGVLVLTVPNEDPPPTTLTIEVEFDSESPVDGTVDVTVGNAPTVEYELSGG